MTNEEIEQVLMHHDKVLRSMEETLNGKSGRDRQTEQPDRRSC